MHPLLLRLTQDAYGDDLQSTQLILFNMWPQLFICSFIVTAVTYVHRHRAECVGQDIHVSRCTTHIIIGSIVHTPLPTTYLVHR